jgi:hypothetical protein
VLPEAATRKHTVIKAVSEQEAAQCGFNLAQSHLWHKLQGFLGVDFGNYERGKFFRKVVAMPRQNACVYWLGTRLSSRELSLKSGFNCRNLCVKWGGEKDPF